MSGGRYDYLFSKCTDPTYACGLNSVFHLKEMERDLRAESRNDAADKIMEYRLFLEETLGKLMDYGLLMENLLYNVEWWASADRGIDAVDKALREFPQNGL
jgi:hypothetical protein